jgi:hypothetical protein
MRLSIEFSLAGALAVILYLTARKESPLLNGVLLALLCAFLLHPLLTLSWITSAQPLPLKIWKIVTVVFLVLIAVGWFGIWVWPVTRPTEQATTERNTDSGARSLQAVAIARLHKLDRSERQFLKSMYDRDTRTSYCESFNPVVLGLVRCGVLRFSAKYVPVYRAPITITDWAWDYLHEHPELLKPAAGTTSPASSSQP